MQFGAGLFDLESFSKRQLSSKIISYSTSSSIHTGLPQWSVKEWREIFYRPDCPAHEFLQEYSKVFNSVEVSSTFYAPVSPDSLLHWSQQVPDGFKFLPKWPKLLTHQQMLNSHPKRIKDFIELMNGFEEKLGPTLLQLPPHFSKDYNRELFHFLQQIPEGFPLALELRHSSWFWPQEAHINERLFDYLAKKKISLVVTDTPSRPDIFHLSSTGPDFIVRYLSDNQAEHDKFRLTWWREILKEVEHQTQVHFIFHTEDNLKTPELVDLFDEELGRLRRSKLEDDRKNDQLKMKFL